MNIAVSDQQFVASPSAEAQNGLGDISWPEIVLLHLGPGALGMGFIIVVAPPLSLVGVPPDLGVLLGSRWSPTSRGPAISFTTESFGVVA